MRFGVLVIVTPRSSGVFKRGSSEVRRMPNRCYGKPVTVPDRAITRIPAAAYNVKL